MEEVNAVPDASLVKAWITRHPRDSRRGFSDTDAMRDGRGYDLGYKLHISVEHERILPLAGALVPANEKRHGPSLIERTRSVLRRAGAGLRSLAADSQISGGRMRSLVGDTVIPYMAGQRRGEDVLRVNRRFRTHGLEEERVRYHKRPMVESAYSFLKTQFGLTVNNVRGLLNVSVYAPLSLPCHVLNREAAENVGRSERARESLRSLMMWRRCLVSWALSMARGLYCLLPGPVLW